MSRTAASQQPGVPEAGAVASVSAAPQLQRSLGLVNVTLYIVTAGSSLEWAATAAAAGPASLIVWAVLLSGAGLYVASSIREFR